MTEFYDSQTLTGYDETPPSDDGVQEAQNLLKWETHTDKIGDPLKDFSEAINAELVATFGDIASEAENIAELKANTPGASPSGLIYVRGYFVAGDGGGGFFTFDAASSDADDGGLTLQPDSLPANGRWKRIFTGTPNFNFWGFDGLEATDNTTLFQTAVTSSETQGFGRMDVPSGFLKLTTPITITRSFTVYGECQGGNGYNSVTAPNRTVVLHDHAGDLFVSDGSFATAQGTGGGFQDVDLVQYFGSDNSTTPSATGGAGSAIKIDGTTESLRSGRNRIEGTSFELWDTASDIGLDWTFSVDIDGSTVGTTKGVRNNWILNTRTVSGIDSTAAIRIFNAFNTWISNVAMDDRDGTSNNVLLVTGPDASNKSTNVNIANSTGHLSVDFASNVKWSGGRIDTVTTTANSSEVALWPCSINIIPALLPGGVLVTSKANRMIVKSDDSQVARLGKDGSYGDSNNTTGWLTGNFGDNQGGIFNFFRNSVSGDQSGGFRGQFRDEADSSDANMCEIEFAKAAGLDHASMSHKVAGVEKFKVDLNNAPFTVPVILQTSTVATVPSASGNLRGMIFVSDETGGATIAFSDGTNWRRVQDLAIVS